MYRLSWNISSAIQSPSKVHGGWCIEICGANQLIDMSQFNFVRCGTGPYRHEKDDIGRLTGSRVGIGPAVWMLTADQEPLLGECEGANRNKLPMAYLTQYLEALEEQGFRISASHSLAYGEGPHQAVTSVWTLNQV